MELTITIDTDRSLSMEEAKELSIQSRAKGMPPHELIVDFIRAGLRELKSPAVASLPTDHQR
jgi:hypothetical protein